MPRACIHITQVAGDFPINDRLSALHINSIAEFWRDPALPYVETRRACHSRACYKPHSHPTFSIGAVDQGISRFTGAIDGPMRIGPGSVVFVPSDCVHACNPLPDTAWSYQMLHLNADWLDAVWQEAAMTRHECVVLTLDAAIYTKFCQLNDLLFSQVSAPEKEAALIEFIGDCDNTMQSKTMVTMPAYAMRERIQPALDFLHQDSVGITPIAELAAMAGLSRYQLIRAFRLSTGMAPHAYQLNLCINQARERIRAGEALADVAYTLGFSDQSHFQRVFKEHAGVTPGRYRS